MYELVLQAPEALVESVSDALMEELDALSVSVEDTDADTDAERRLEMTAWARAARRPRGAQARSLRSGRACAGQSIARCSGGPLKVT